MEWPRWQMTVVGWLLMVMGLSTGCIRKADSTQGSLSSGTTSTLVGSTATVIVIDGSSTVYPISQGLAEAFRRSHPEIDITVGLSGTTAGFKKFLVRELDLCGASRPIRDSEKKLAEERGIEYLELAIAIDALTVVVNPANDWAHCLSVAELKRIWEPNSQVQMWSDIRPEWPQEKIELYGADPDSGTFDYFTEAIVGEARKTRTDYTGNANDNILVHGVAEGKYALGYFGYGYYRDNEQRLKAVAIRAQEDGECVLPNADNVRAGKYVPLARPLFLYATRESLKRSEVQNFLRFALSDEGQRVVEQRKFLPLQSDLREEMQQRLEQALSQ
ncbi:MAG: phosphate ABC transporter substrate-binding protein [Planctomycetaceae bacterium]|nr:MAG: phosphate ABC transporter substrate-binding protein [Planctomycetaceae bacterium]